MICLKPFPVVSVLLLITGSFLTSSPGVWILCVAVLLSLTATSVSFQPPCQIAQALSPRLELCCFFSVLPVLDTAQLPVLKCSALLESFMQFMSPVASDRGKGIKRVLTLLAMLLSLFASSSAPTVWGSQVLSFSTELRSTHPLFSCEDQISPVSIC